MLRYLRLLGGGVDRHYFVGVSIFFVQKYDVLLIATGSTLRPRIQVLAMTHRSSRLHPT